MSNEEFVLVALEAGIPYVYIMSYLDGTYTPEEWREIWVRYSN